MRFARIVQNILALCNNINMNIGEKIQYLRKEKGLTQQELAKALNIGWSTVANYEKDYRKPDLDTLKNICLYFNVSADYFIFDKEV